MSGLTALIAIREAGEVESGTRVLINGASGGVGTFAVQIAHALGADVTGVSSARNLELLQSLGPDHAPRPARRRARPPTPLRRAHLTIGSAARRPDAPLSEQQFRRRLHRLGIRALPARIGALHSLAASLPPAIHADLLRISESGAANWARQAAGDWAGYAASRSSDEQPLAQKATGAPRPGRIARRRQSSR